MVKYKQKGAYWHPDPMNYTGSISNASPPCWYKDLGNIVSTRAAIAAMTLGIDPEAFIRCHTDPFDFMCRAKVSRGSTLHLGDREVQRTTRYYVAVQGAPLYKLSPPPAGCISGTYKRANGVTQAEYNRVMDETHGEWDARVCTKNKSRYDIARTNIQNGYMIAECNDAKDFSFANVNYQWYVNEAKKLIIP